MLAGFLDSMKADTEGEHTLLDRTAIFYASNLGNSSSHDNTNLPILLGGRRVQARGSRRVRPQEQRAVVEPVRADAAPDGHRGEVVRRRHERRERSVSGRQESGRGAPNRSHGARSLCRRGFVLTRRDGAPAGDLTPCSVAGSGASRLPARSAVATCGKTRSEIIPAPTRAAATPGSICLVATPS